MSGKVLLQFQEAIHEELWFKRGFKQFRKVWIAMANGNEPEITPRMNFYFISG